MTHIPAFVFLKNILTFRALTKVLDSPFFPFFSMHLLRRERGGGGLALRSGPVDGIQLGLFSVAHKSMGN